MGSRRRWPLGRSDRRERQDRARARTRCERYTRKRIPPCCIAAFDAETGKELWRTSTIQRPGDPGPDTWGGLPLMFRAGGDNWQAGSYDPKTNLTYWGTAQAKPWMPFQRGTDGDGALYELHPRAESRYRQDGVVPPAHSRARRSTWTKPSSAS